MTTLKEPIPAAVEVTSAPADVHVDETGVLHDRAIGDILREVRDLSDDQIQRILVYQREHRMRFGEAAIKLGLATQDDVLYALARQFHYPYAPLERRRFTPELVTLNQPFSYQSEALRAVRQQVMARVFSDGAPKAALAVVSPDTGDGKTFFTANLAVTLAQLGGRTLVVDADLRGPRQHEVFAIDNSSGLSGILSGRAEKRVIQQIEGVPNLYVLPVGVTPPNPAELVERPAFALLMRELIGKFDHVLVDTPAAVYGADAFVIAARCGSALVIARKDASSVGALQDMVGAMAESPARLAGVIMNEY